MALNPIEILKDTISSVLHTITITSVVSLGASKYRLNTSNTLYLRTALAKKTITIDGVDYFIVDFQLNTYLTVKATDGTDQAVTASSFSINPPLFVWGNPQMVSAELVKRVANQTVIWPYMWIVELGTTSGTLDPAAAVKETRNFNIFFLDSADKVNWTIEQHYDNDIYTLNNYIDFFFDILRSRRDLFETDSITYTKDNHVNFGDYIVDEGMKELILNGAITGIQLQVSIPYIIDSCTDTKVTPNCPVIVESFNGASISSPVTQKTIIVQSDAVGAPQVGTAILDTPTALTVEVPAGGGDPVDTDFNDTPTTVDTPAGDNLKINVENQGGVDLGTLTTNTANIKTIVINTDDDIPVHYVRPILSQAVQQLVHDEKWHIDNGTFDYTIPVGTKPQQLDPYQHDMLLYNSVWGHKFRFVGSLGGYYDESDSNYYDVDGVLSTRDTEFLLSASYYIIDEYTGIGYRGTRFATTTLALNLSNAPYSYSGFTDFYPSPVQFNMGLMRQDRNLQLYLSNRPPFDVQLTLWSCTFVGTGTGTTSTTNAFFQNTIFNIGPAAITASRAALFARAHYT